MKRGGLQRDRLKRLIDGLNKDGLNRVGLKWDGLKWDGLMRNGLMRDGIEEICILYGFQGP